MYQAVLIKELFERNNLKSIQKHINSFTLNNCPQECVGKINFVINC